MPRDHRRYAAEAGNEGRRPCSRGTWCASRTVAIVDGERIITPALGPRAFCDHDTDLIGTCISELPAMFGRLQDEIAEPAAAETSVHIPFGPSVPVRLDVDAAMRMTAVLLRTWDSRVRAIKPLSPRPPGMPVLSAESVAHAAGVLAGNLTALLALQNGWMTHNVALHPGRHGQPATLSPAVLEEYGDAEIVRVGADFIGVFIQRDGASAGLEFLHLHYWCRAVLRETPARPEELTGVECRADGCSLRALRRAEPPWHSGDPEYYSECAACGDLCTEDEYRLWTGQLAAYHGARLAAMPALGRTPAA